MFFPHDGRITGAGMKLVLNTVQNIPTRVQNLFVEENIFASHVTQHNGFKSEIYSANI